MWQVKLYTVTIIVSKNSSQSCTKPFHENKETLTKSPQMIALQKLPDPRTQKFVHQAKVGPFVQKFKWWPMLNLRDKLHWKCDRGDTGEWGNNCNCR